jgi:MATE family multidrug resistance protein
MQSTVRVQPASRKIWIEEARALIVLAGPLIFAQLAQMAILATDILFLGRLSTHALAAAAIGNAIYYFVWIAASATAFAVPPMIAQLRGAKPRDRAGVRAVVRMGLWSGVLVSLPLMAILLVSEHILLALKQDPGLAHDAGLFLAMLCFGLPFTIGFNVLRNFSTAVDHPNSGLWVMLAAILFNAVAGYSLIFGHLGLPALGILGAGIATSLSAAFSFLVMIALTVTLPDLAKFRPFRRFFRPRWAALAELFRLGIPICVTILFEAMLFNVMTLVMGTFGAGPLAAHQIAMNVASITFMVPMGLGMATTVRVGNHTGAGDHIGARRAGIVALAVGLGFISICAVVMALFGRQIAALYVVGRTPDDVQVIALAGGYLVVAAAFQVFDAAQVVGAMCLRGLKDAHVPMILAGASYWIAGAPVCLLLGYGLHMEGTGVWIGMAFGLMVAAVLMCGRFHFLTRWPDRGSLSQSAAINLSN